MECSNEMKEEEGQIANLEAEGRALNARRCWWEENETCDNDVHIAAITVWTPSETRIRSRLWKPSTKSDREDGGIRGVRLAVFDV